MFILMYSKNAALHWAAASETAEGLEEDFERLKEQLSPEEIAAIVPLNKIFQNIHD